MKQLFILGFLSLAIMAAADQKALENSLHDGNNQFTANMFTEVSKINPEKSFVLSGFSVLTPLAQLALASVGESHDELLHAVGMPDDRTLKEVFSLANTRVKSIKDVTLKMASKIYVAKGFEINSDFAKVTRDTFDSEFENLDFNKQQNAAKTVNTWVEEQTNNRIKDLINPDSLGSDTRALIVNAIYFKGTWEAQFEKRLTREKDFHVNKKDTIKVSMMNRKGNYKYTDSSALKSQVLQIPYKGGETSLIVVLPKDIEGIKEVQEILHRDPQVLDNILVEMRKTEVEVYLPKFKIETTTNLMDILKKLNVKKMFSPGEARLENLLYTKEDLYIDEAIQKAFIEVNEEGAEAAAANDFGFVATSFIINEQPPPVFNADRPFYFVIKSDSLTLFNGIFYAQ